MHCLVFADTMATAAYQLMADEPGATHVVFVLPESSIVTHATVGAADFA